MVGVRITESAGVWGCGGGGAWGCEGRKSEGEKQMVGVVVVAKMNEKGEGGVERNNNKILIIIIIIIIRKWSGRTVWRKVAFLSAIL